MRGGGKEQKKVSGKDKKYNLQTEDLGNNNFPLMNRRKRGEFLLFVGEKISFWGKWVRIESFFF